MRFQQKVNVRAKRIPRKLQQHAKLCPVKPEEVRHVDIGRKGRPAPVVACSGGVSRLCSHALQPMRPGERGHAQKGYQVAQGGAAVLYHAEAKHDQQHA